jgi:hypothetical protein
MKVFISYSSKDESLAKEVATTLEKAGLSAWYDSEIMPGQNWAEEIAKRLNESDAMVVLLTPHALESNWMRRDIDYALSRKAFNNRLIPVIVGDFPQYEVPWIFNHLKTIRLSEHGRNEEQLKQIAQALKEAA